MQEVVAVLRPRHEHQRQRAAGGHRRDAPGGDPILALGLLPGLQDAEGARGRGGVERLRAGVVDGGAHVLQDRSGAVGRAARAGDDVLLHRARLLDVDGVEGHELVRQRVVVAGQRRRREEAERARAEAKVVEPVGAVAPLEVAAAHQQLRHDVRLEERLPRGLGPVVERRRGLDLLGPRLPGEPGVVRPRLEEGPAGVAHAAGRDGQRPQEDLALIDVDHRRIVGGRPDHEARHLRVVEGGLGVRIVAALTAGQVHVGLHRAVAAAVGARRFEHRLDVGLEVLVGLAVGVDGDALADRRKRVAAGTDPLVGDRLGRDSVAVGAVVEPVLQLEVGLGVGLDRRAAAVLDLARVELSLVRDLIAPRRHRLQQQERLRVAAVGPEHVAPLLDPVERREIEVTEGRRRVGDRVDGDAVAGRRVADAGGVEDRLDVDVVEMLFGRRGRPAAEAAPSQPRLRARNRPCPVGKNAFRGRRLYQVPIGL